jgi:hypothetical protein
LADEKVKKQEESPGPDGEVCRDLVCAEEWKDPANRKVITEFHKEGLPKELMGADADLESFEGYWKKKGGSVKVKGEYHKEGAPFLDRNVIGDSMKEPEDSFNISGGRQPEPEFKIVGPEDQAQDEPGLHSKEINPQATVSSPPQGKIQRPIDLSLVEVISYALFRVAFSKGLRIPIKRDGMVDMDVTVNGKEITINTNQLFFTVPELNVWHVVYQHKGKPILELGRGVKNGMAIHRMQALRLGLEMWNGSRKMNKLKLKQMKEADKKAHIEAAK